MACMQMFRRKFLRPDTIALVPHSGYDNDTHSVEALQWLKWIEHRLGRELQHARSLGGEKHIGPYKVDGWDETTKTVYEFYGCLWHGCPTCYPHREHKLPRVETTVEDAHVKLTERQEWLINEVRRQEGQLEKIWECEFRLR